MFHDILARFDIPLPERPHRLVDITDPGKDLDDEQKFVLLAALARAGVVEIAAVVANLEPPLQRARLAKGTFRALGFEGIPVGVGTDCFVGGQTRKHETDVPYLADERELVADGHQLLVDTLQQSGDRSIILTLNSGLTDAARLARSHPELFARKVLGVTIMGGVKAADPGAPLLEDGLLVPDDAANNAFDMEAAIWLYRRLQEMGVPMTILMRSACYAAPFPIRLYDAFVATGNPVGKGLRDRQTGSIQQLWQAAIAPEGSPVRGKLPTSRDRAWFVAVYCGGRDPGLGHGDDIWPHVGSHNQYDPMAIVAAVPELRDRFFDPVEAVVGGTLHRIVGLSAQRTGVKDRDGLVAFVSEMEIAALGASSGR